MQAPRTELGGEQATEWRLLGGAHRKSVLSHRGVSAAQRTGLGISWRSRAGYIDMSQVSMYPSRSPRSEQGDQKDHARGVSAAQRTGLGISWRSQPRQIDMSNNSENKLIVHLRTRNSARAGVRARVTRNSTSQQNKCKRKIAVQNGGLQLLAVRERFENPFVG